MKTYSFLDVLCGFVGPGVVISLGAGSGNSDEGISFTPNGEINSTQIGADGEGMHTLHADKSGRITVRLLKSSHTNQALSAALAFQRTSSAAHGQNTISLVDKNKGDTVTCQQVAFQKVPDLSFGKEAQMVEWIFSCIKMDFNLGS